MRAREFTINVPINIKIDGDGDPEVSTNNEMGEFSSLVQQKLDLLKQVANTDTTGQSQPIKPFAQPVAKKVVQPPQTEYSDDGDTDGTFVPPLQQKIELMKHAAGKQGPVIDQITADDDNEAS
jgi:hypothetical protein